MDSQTPADGRFHPAKGSDYVDSIAVKIVSSNEVVETNKVKGRLAYESRYVLSEDSQTLTWKVTSYANATNAPVESSTTWRRISQDPSAAHRLAGKWQQSGVSLNGGANDWLLKMSGNVFSNRTPQGSGYTAQIGGPAVLNEGDSAGAMVSIVKPDPYTIIEYHSLKKDVRAILLLQASPEAESLKAVAIMPKTGKATSFVLRRVAQAR